MNSCVGFILTTYLTFCLFCKAAVSQCPNNCACLPRALVTIHCSPGHSDIPQNIPNNTFALSVSGTFSHRNSIARLSKSDFSNLMNLQRLHLTFSGIREIEDGTFSNLKKLTQLNLANNDITRITAKTLEGLDNLEVLHLTGNEYCRIDQDAFSNLKSLTELHMGQIRIMSVDPITFDGLNGIQILDLHGNDLQVFDQGIFKKLPQLEYLDLSGNLFQKMSNVSEVNFSKLKTVHLFDNPWQCNCELEWMRNLRNAFKSGNPVICAGPKDVEYMSLTDLMPSDFHCREPKIVRCDRQVHDVTLNSYLRIACEIDGDPFPKVTWVSSRGQRMGGGSIHNINYRVFENGTMEILQSDVHDQGIWTIEVSSSQGRKQEDLKVNVHIPTTTTPTTKPTTTTKATTTSTTATKRKMTTTTIRTTTKSTTPRIITKLTTNRPAKITNRRSTTTDTSNSGKTNKRADNTAATTTNGSALTVGVILAAVGGGLSLVTIVSLSIVLVKSKVASNSRVGDRRRLSDSFDSVRTPRSSRGLTPVSYAWA